MAMSKNKPNLPELLGKIMAEAFIMELEDSNVMQSACERVLEEEPSALAQCDPYDIALATSREVMRGFTEYIEGYVEEAVERAREINFDD